MTAKLRPLCLALVLPLALAGCSALSALEDASQPLDIYELRTPELPRTASRRNIEIVVAEPVASGALATERIMIRPSPLQAQYLPGVRWADTAPVMVQTLMVRSFTETGAFGSVGRGPIGTLPDFTVLSELTDFQAEAADDESAAIIRVRLVIRLVRENDAKVLASQAFAVSVNAASTDANTVVAAFDVATSRLLADIVPWIARRAATS